MKSSTDGLDFLSTETSQGKKSRGIGHPCLYVVVRLHINVIQWLIPSHTLVSKLREKPRGHSHWKLPKVLMHCPPWHSPGSSWHSLMSTTEKTKKNPETLSCVAVCVYNCTHMIPCPGLTFQNDSDRVGSEAFSSRTQRLVPSCNTEEQITVNN